MDNNVTYFPTAKWAVLEGAFTVDDLKDIIARIEDPELQSTPIESEARSAKIVAKTVEDARVRQEARQSKD